MLNVEDKMAKARAARKPPKYKNIHEDVKELPDDDTLSVKEWLKKTNKRFHEEPRFLDNMPSKCCYWYDKIEIVILSYSLVIGNGKE